VPVFVVFANGIANGGRFLVAEVRMVKAQLGRRLPAAYIALARGHNGGHFRP